MEGVVKKRLEGLEYIRRVGVGQECVEVNDPRTKTMSREFFCLGLVFG